MSLPERIRQERGHGRKVRITEPEPEIWRVEFLNWGMRNDDGGQIIEVDYDHNRGVITQAVWRHRTVPTAWKRIDFELQKLGSDIWVPKMVQDVQLLDKPKIVSRLYYTNVKINEPIDERVYQLEFPAGSQVVDYVEKKAYTVGQTPKDEQEMIKAFVRLHGLTVPPTPLWKRALWWGVPGVFALSAGVFAVRRWRRQAVAAGLLGLLLAGAGAAPAAEPTPGKETNSGPKVHLSQCGFQVTVFTLAAFGVECDADQVAGALMPAGFDGISLAKVQETLQAHRLRAEARQHLTVAELKQALQSGWIAIIPVQGEPTCHDYDFGGKPSNWNHYVVALHHPESGPVLIDVLRKIMPLDRSPLKDEHLRDPKRAVLFVRR
jgi:hypothetical protein